MKVLKIVLYKENDTTVSIVESVIKQEKDNLGFRDNYVKFEPAKNKNEKVNDNTDVGEPIIKYE